MQVLERLVIFESSGYESKTIQHSLPSCFWESLIYLDIKWREKERSNRTRFPFCKTTELIRTWFLYLKFSDLFWLYEKMEGKRSWVLWYKVCLEMIQSFNINEKIISLWRLYHNPFQNRLVGTSHIYSSIFFHFQNTLQDPIFGSFSAATIHST